VYGITPFYNEELTIGSVAASIVAWKKRGRFGKHLLKWVMIDDGSSDNSKQIVEVYAKHNPFIKLITLKRNMGKGYAYKVGGEWLVAHDPKIEERIVLQLDGDLRGIQPSNLDTLIKRLLEIVRVKGKGLRRLAVVALVPSPHKFGLRKWFRERLAFATARERLAITGQRAYFGGTMMNVLPLIDANTGFGLEALLDAETIRESKYVKRRYGLTERQRRQLIWVTKWDNVKHVSHIEKVKFTTNDAVEGNPIMGKHMAVFRICKHYLTLGIECGFGIIKGVFGVRKRWMSKRQSKKGRV